MFLVTFAACHAATEPPLAALATTIASDLAPQLALLEHDNATYAVGPDLITIATAARRIDVRAPGDARWSAAVTVMGVGSDESWVVGLAGGSLYRILASGLGDRLDEMFGVTVGSVTAIASAGRTFVIAARDQVLISVDGTHLKRFRGGAVRVATARTRVALAKADGVEVFDLVRETSTRYAVEAAEVAFLEPFGPTPRLVARTARSVLVERAGKLRELEVADVVQLAVAGKRLWLRTPREVWLLDDDRVHPTTLAPSERGRIFGALAGDVWLADGGTVRRYQVGRSRDDWARVVEPVVRSACVPCHEPAHDTAIDLSTPERWNAMRSKIYRRVVMERTMPPETPLSDHELATLRSWLER